MNSFSKQKTTWRLRLCRYSGVTLCLLFAVSANAATPLEDKIFHAAMPHEALGNSGTTIKVYRVHMDGYLQGQPDNQTRLSELKQQIQSCVDFNTRNGKPSNPPHTWPDFIIGMRSDTYVSANRVIEYAHGTNYMFGNADCSLMEMETSRAELVSAKGACHIDLLLKTARGVCDAAGHADAPASPRLAMPVTPANKARIDAMASDPRYASMFATLKQQQKSYGTPTGQKKTIAGVECEVWNQLSINDGGLGGTVCANRGGSFVPPTTGLTPGGAGVLLEVESGHGVKMKAVDARLDTQVSAKVFAPYMDGGFSIKDSGQRK
jgi:hypothetical protein